MSKRTVHIEIDGMSCGHCIKAVREALEGLDGVEIREVLIGKAVVEIDETRVTDDQLAAAIDDTGYPVLAVV